MGLLTSIVFLAIMIIIHTKFSSSTANGLYGEQCLLLGTFLNHDVLKIKSICSRPVYAINPEKLVQIRPMCCPDRQTRKDSKHRYLHHIVFHSVTTTDSPS